MKEKIRPLTKNCTICKTGQVIDHHWVCNDCWNKREKQKLREWSDKLNKDERRAWRRLTKEERVESLIKQGKMKRA
jgi:hypothetical protein